MQTEVGLIAHLLEATVEAPTPLQKEVARLGRVLGIAVLVIAVAVVATILLISDVRRGADLIDVLLLSVALAAALPLAVAALTPESSLIRRAAPKAVSSITLARVLSQSPSPAVLHQLGPRAYPLCRSG